jgi:pyruvate/2-oxoglutarate/acetoin dehydrogenase E1 component
VLLQNGKRGISAEVIDLRTIRPMDWMTVLESVKKTNRLVIVKNNGLLHPFLRTCLSHSKEGLII